MNKVIMIGNLANDVNSGYTQNGKVWCRFSIAVNRRYTDQNGQRQADFFNVIVWGKCAENCINYLSKGRKVGVEGSLENRSFDGNDGQKHYVTEIIADNVEFLGSRQTAAANDAAED